MCGEVIPFDGTGPAWAGNNLTCAGPGVETMYDYEDLDDEFCRRNTGGVMPVGGQASRKAAQRKTQRGKQVSREIGRARAGIRHRRARKLAW